MTAYIDQAISYLSSLSYLASYSNVTSCCNKSASRFTIIDIQEMCIAYPALIATFKLIIDVVSHYLQNKIAQSAQKQEELQTIKNTVTQLEVYNALAGWTFLVFDVKAPFLQSVMLVGIFFSYVPLENLNPMRKKISQLLSRLPFLVSPLLVYKRPSKINSAVLMLHILTLPPIQKAIHRYLFSE